jgi:hypothetical protein
MGGNRQERGCQQPCDEQIDCQNETCAAHTLIAVAATPEHMAAKKRLMQDRGRRCGDDFRRRPSQL